MQIEVRLFGGLTERVGRSRVTIELPDDATVAELRDEVARVHPAIAPLLPRVAVAVDLEVARDTTPLAGAREVALLPPVAGGAGVGDPDGVRVVTGLRTRPFDVDAVLAEVAGPEVGGTAVFLGTVRDHAPDLAEVTELRYSTYPEMAERVLADLATAIAADHPAVRGIALLHAVGDLAVGDHTVLIVCAAAHRGAAFDACRDALERVKDQLPVWKHEVAADGTSRWVGLPPA